ncbi:MAG: N-6 DNA methylase [Burkholderiaceae bacterium]|nr:N-6 DNA methylase [Burkholderiaceae bacterium]
MASQSNSTPSGSTQWSRPPRNEHVRICGAGRLCEPEARRKRLGQYFSGPPLARLLVVLAARPSIRSAIDPMAGRGDMLVAARGLLPKCSQLHGIEIDPVAHGQCAATLEGTNALCLSGNAFDPATLSLLAPHGYDLVVTNPPYVRYQAQKHGAGTQVRLPSALEVRNGLRRCLGNLPHLCDSDRADFLALAEGYSGHSDLAVPSWILCAALLAPGGTLAMVVPEAWLNRDYAAIVRYLLLRWFRIEFIVEDAHAAWFSDALVKTTLLVAHRTGARASAHAWSDETYLHVSLPSTLASEESLLGRSRYARTRHAERAFARHARALLGGKADTLDDAIAWQRVRMADQAAALHGAAHGDSWYRRLESGTQFAPGQVSQVPPSLAGLLPASSGFTTLAQAGVSVGQGAQNRRQRVLLRRRAVAQRADGPIEAVQAVRWRNARCPRVLHRPCGAPAARYRCATRVGARRRASRRGAGVAVVGTAGGGRGVLRTLAHSAGGSRTKGCEDPCRRRGRCEAPSGALGGCSECAQGKCPCGHAGAPLVHAARLCPPAPA